LLDPGSSSGDVSKSGARLLHQDAVATDQKSLFPSASLLTSNLHVIALLT
tara:strand:- start:298 stop:447 length:150 start_codon:yes stop_codon:yes gene_type:complete